MCAHGILYVKLYYALKKGARKLCAKSSVIRNEMWLGATFELFPVTGKEFYLLI